MKSLVAWRFRRFLETTRGVSAIEYALLVGLVAVAVGAAIVTFSGDLQETITNIGDQVALIDVTGQGDIAADADANN